MVAILLSLFLAFWRDVLRLWMNDAGFWQSFVYLGVENLALLLELELLRLLHDVVAIVRYRNPQMVFTGVR